MLKVTIKGKIEKKKLEKLMEILNKVFDDFFKEIELIQFEEIEKQ